MAGAVALLALTAGAAWSQTSPTGPPADAPRPPTFVNAKKKAPPEISAPGTAQIAVRTPETRPAKTKKAAPRQRADSPIDSPEDPRDVKLRELEARLVKTERQLDAFRLNSAGSTAEPPGGEGERAIFGTEADLFSASIASQEEFRTDTERMETSPTMLPGTAPAGDGFRTDTERMEAAPPPELNVTYPTHTITGFLQIDTAFYSQDPKNQALVGNAQDGTGFRRARLAVLGKVAPKTLYQLEVDFAAAGRPSFFDNYLEQVQLPFLGAVRAGQYLQPFSVDAMSGFRNLPFLERSLPFLAFVPFRRVGIQASNNSEDERTFWAYSGFRTGGFNNAPLGDSQFGTDFGNIGGYSFSTRVTHLVNYDGDGNLWHVGAAYDFSQLGANNAVGSGTPGNAGSPAPFYQAKAAPEFGLLGQPQNGSNFGSAVNGTPNFVDTGRYAAHSFNLVGVETVYQNGPFSFQSEWMLTEVNSVVGPITYTGAYAEGMYRLTGETRGYDKKLGALKNVVPFNDFVSFDRNKMGEVGLGAWEIAGRLSYVDLRNPSSLLTHYYNSATNTFKTTAAQGAAAALGNGTLTDTTLGMTWFLNTHSKFQFNWIHAFLNNKATGFSQADLFVTRIQVDF